MRRVFWLLTGGLSLLLLVGLSHLPALSAPGRSPGLPSITVPNRLRVEWVFRPSSPLAGSAANHMPVMVLSSFRNVTAGRYLGVHNGAPVLMTGETMEFQFEPRDEARVLNYQREVVIKSRSGQFLVAARLGERPVLAWSSRAIPEWVVLGGQPGTPVTVDTPVALGNVVVRHNELVYCPATVNGLDWDIQCPAAPSAAGEQPTNVAPSQRR